MNTNTCTIVNKLLKEMSVTNCCVPDCQYLDCTIFFFCRRNGGQRNGWLHGTHKYTNTHTAAPRTESGGCSSSWWHVCVWVCVCLCVKKADWCRGESGGIQTLAKSKLKCKEIQQRKEELISCHCSPFHDKLLYPVVLLLMLVLWQLRFMESFNYFMSPK